MQYRMQNSKTQKRGDMRKKEDRLKTAAFVLSAGVFFGVCPSIVLADEPGEWRKKMAVSIGMKMA